MLRVSFWHAAHQDWEKIAKSFKPVYTAPTEDAATTRFLKFTEDWREKYPAIVKLWESLLGRVTNAIESVNARIRKAVRARGRFPTEAAALKCVYLAGDEPRPHREGPQALEHPLEASTPSVRHRLRRPHLSNPNLTHKPHQLHPKLDRPD